MKKGKFGLALFSALVLLAVLGMALHRVPEPVSGPPVAIRAGEETLNVWTEDGETYVAFLPGHVAFGEVAVKSVQEGAMVDGRVLPLSGAALEPDRSYKLTWQENGEDRQGTLRLLPSAGMPALFLDTQSGSMDHIHDQKGNAERGTLRLYDETGCLNFSNSFASLRGRGNSTWEVPEKKPYALDLSDEASYASYASLLEEEKPNVALLVNCSGFGKFQSVSKTPLSDNLDMVKLNCMALMAMCQITEPYMQRGGQIINIASVAAYQPIPYINVYGASKSFVLHFSRALNRELKRDGISVMAVCPFWTKTDFFDRAIDEDKERVVKKYIAMYTPEQIVSRACSDLKKGKDVSMYGFKARGQALLVKLLPHSLVMSVWMKQQELE